MNIRVVTSLTTTDEDQLAPAVLTAIASLLADLPVSYAVRVESAGGVVLQHTNLPPAAVGAPLPDAAATPHRGRSDA